ncbi:MAG: SpoVR family protein [Acidimicrobiales bacterium]
MTAVDPQLQPESGHEGRRAVAIYDLAELQRLDDECRAAAAGLGLDVPEVVFHLAPAERIYDIAARGLPGRYPHWRFGQDYERMKLDHDHGRSRIYELVLNTQPYQAYLLEGNSWVAQLLVMAHVYGHCWFFEHNDHFRPADRKFLLRVRAGAERIEDYCRRHGRREVEDFVDAVQAVAHHAPSRLVATPRSGPPPAPVADRYADLFPDETAAAAEQHHQERAAWAARVPREPEPDLLGFLMAHGPRLADWQRDVISIIREEAAYFFPQRRTKIANEGFAVWVHSQIVQALQLGTGEFVEYNRLNAGIGQPHPFSVNPYNLGYELWREVERIYDDPTPEERERFPGAGEISGRDRVLELAATCDDASLVAAYLTPGVCDRCQLYAWRAEGATRLRCTSREADEIRRALVNQLSHLSVPRVEITDADAFRAGGLWLAHRPEGVGLDAQYAANTLPHVAALWGRRVYLETVAVADDGAVSPLWFTCAPGDETAEAHTTEPEG